MHNLQAHILVHLRVDWTVFVTEWFHKVRFSDLGMFFVVFDEVCKEHEVLFVILLVKVMKLQTHNYASKLHKTNL